MSKVTHKFGQAFDAIAVFRPERRMTSLAVLVVAVVLATFQFSHAAILPTVSSATLSAHFDASDINNDGGATDPGNGNNLTSWTNLVSGTTLNVDVAPNFVSAGSGGINNQDTVRFTATTASGDLLFNNSMNFTAQTIFSVVTMVDKAGANAQLATLMANSGAGLNIRQTTTDHVASYFSGNAADFVIDNSTAVGGGTININGNRRLSIPGGFGAAHVIKAERTSAVGYVGYRLSDNVAANRRWNGDVAEIIVYNSTLSGDDTLAVQSYLTEKYGITYNTALDERINESKQIALNQGTSHVAANFHYGGPTTTGTFQGIEFENIDLTGAAPPAGPFILDYSGVASGSATLTLTMPFTGDNAQRNQNASITGTDAAVLNTVANEFFYLSNGGGHPSAGMLFAGLPELSRVFVQVIGGDEGWTGDIQVVANGGAPIDWLGVSDGAAAGSASLFGFYATTDSLGQLDLDFTVPTGNFAGIGGIILSFHVSPEPASIVLASLCVAGIGLMRRQRRTRRA